MLGTQFSVGLTSEDVNVVVLTGKVKLTPERDAKDVVLTQNQTTSFHAVRMGDPIGTVNAREVLYWRNAQWVFQAAPLHEVVQSLAKSLGVPVSVPGAYANLPVTAVLPMGQPLQALKTVAASHGLAVVAVESGWALQAP